MEISGSFVFIKYVGTLFESYTASFILNNPNISCFLFNVDYTGLFPFALSLSSLILFRTLRVHWPVFYNDLNHERVSLIVYISIPCINFVCAVAQTVSCQHLCRIEYLTDYYMDLTHHQNETVLPEVYGDDDCWLPFTELSFAATLLLFVIAVVSNKLADKARADKLRRYKINPVQTAPLLKSSSGNQNTSNECKPVLTCGREEEPLILLSQYGTHERRRREGHEGGIRNPKSFSELGETGQRVVALNREKNSYGWESEPLDNELANQTLSKHETPLKASPTKALKEAPHHKKGKRQGQWDWKWDNTIKTIHVKSCIENDMKEIDTVKHAPLGSDILELKTLTSICENISTEIDNIDGSSFPSLESHKSVSAENGIEVLSVHHDVKKETNSRGLKIRHAKATKVMTDPDSLILALSIALMTIVFVAMFPKYDESLSWFIIIVKNFAQILIWISPWLFILNNNSTRRRFERMFEIKLGRRDLRRKSITSNKKGIRVNTLTPSQKRVMINIPSKTGVSSITLPQS